MRVPTGSTDRQLYFVAVDATDLKTREIGLTTFTVVRSRNGAADVTYTTPTVTEIDSVTMPGVYSLLIDEDTTITTGKDEEEVCVHITHAGMAPVTRTFELYRPKITEGQTVTASNSKIDGVVLVDTITTYTGNTPQTANHTSNIAAILADSNELQIDWTDGGRLDLILDARASQTSVTIIDDFLDTEIAAMLVIMNKLDTAMVLDGAVWQFTVNALELAPTGGSAPSVVQIRQEMDTNSTQLAAIVTDTNELQTDWVNNGRLDLLIDAIKAKTDTIPVSPAAVGSAMTLSGAANTAIVTELFATLIEASGDTFGNTLKLLWAFIAGISDIQLDTPTPGITTLIFKNKAGTKNRITAQINAANERISIVFDVT